MLITEEIKENFKSLCIAAKHTLTRAEYRTINNIPEYNSSKIEALWGSWNNFISDVSHTINFNRYDIRKTVKKTINNIVITSVVDGSDINIDCFKTLIKYCEEEKCKLYVLWGKSLKQNSHFSQEEYSILEPYLVTNLTFEKDARCKAADLLVSVSAKNPLNSLDRLSKGLDTIIIGSTKQYLDVLPYDPTSKYKIAVGTGSISTNIYKSSVSGMLDEQNHTFGALRLEWNTTENRYNIRQLQYKNDCICDITMKKYTKDSIVKISNVPCMVLGDLHAPETDMQALNNTIVLINKLNVKEVMIHDWMSYQSINHHEQDKALTKLLNTTSETCSLETELKFALEIMNGLAKKCSKTQFNIIHSNHDEFLMKWLNRGEFAKSDPANRVIGCELFANIAKGKNIFENKFVKNIKMLDYGQNYKINGFEVGRHGDTGIAGAKGNSLAYTKAYDNCIIGHSHSPKIKETTITVGTLSKLRLSYNRDSIPNWAHANAIIHENGSFQLLFV